MAQKVIRIGKSAGITISKDALEELEWKLGDIVYLHIDSARRRIIVSKNRKEKIKLLSERDRKLLEWTKNFIETYRKDLEVLARG